MNSQHMRQAIGILGLVALMLIPACEDDSQETDDTAPPESTMTEDKSRDTSASPEVEQEDSTPSPPTTALEETDVFVQLDPLPTTVSTTTVDALSFLQPDGTYLADGQVFTNCDNLGFYFLSQSTTDLILLVNCGTAAFP